jgi:cell division protein FtsI/penicillin-binding protein 2
VLKEAKATPLAEVSYFQDNPTEMKLSPVNVKIVDSAMWGVVKEGGTAGRVAFPRELNIGGKTGTAQVIAREKVRSKEHKDHSWFIGFAPMKTDEPPDIGVVCITENGGWGAQASGPKVKYIMAAYYSKKLGRQILPDLVAANGKPEAIASTSTARAVTDVDRKRAAVRQ